MSNENTRALTELLSEAQKLKSHRSVGDTYSDKCDNFVGRMQFFFENTNLEALSHDQMLLLKSLKDVIVSEELFAKSSIEIRSPESWKGFLHE